MKSVSLFSNAWFESQEMLKKHLDKVERNMNEKYGVWQEILAGLVVNEGVASVVVKPYCMVKVRELDGLPPEKFKGKSRREGSERNGSD